MESDRYPQQQKEKLKAIKATLNPFELQADLQKKLALFHKLNDEYNKKNQPEDLLTQNRLIKRNLGNRIKLGSTTA